MEIITKIADYLSRSSIAMMFISILCILAIIDMLQRERSIAKMNKENLVIRLPEEVKEALTDAAYIAGSTMSQKAREYIIERLTEEGHLKKRIREVEK